MRLTFVAVVAAALVGALAGGASAADTLDQQQPIVNLAVGGNAIGGGSQQMLAQTVTAGQSGELAEVQLPPRALAARTCSSRSRPSRTALRTALFLGR
jgi:hypothetical protein